MPDAAIQLRDRAAQVGCQLRLSQPGVEVLPGRLQHEEVRSPAVLVVAAGKFLGFAQGRQNFTSHGLQILAGLNELGMSIADVERDLITNGHVLPHGLFPLSVGDRDAALISIEDGNGKTQSRSGFVTAASSSAVRIVNCIEVHELVTSQTSPLSGGFNRNLGSSQVRPHCEGFVHKSINVTRHSAEFRFRHGDQFIAVHSESHDCPQCLTGKRYFVLSTLRGCFRLKGINPGRCEFQLADVTGIKPFPGEICNLLTECGRLVGNFSLLARGNEIRMSHTGITNHVQPVLHH